MSTAFILIVLWTAFERPASFTQEYNTKAKCEAAKELVSHSKANITLAICTEK